MAGQVLKKRRLINTGVRRRLSRAQIPYFGSKRQKAALNRRRNAGSFSRRKTKKRLKAFSRKMQSRGIPIPHSFASETVKRYAKRNQGGGLVSQAEHAAASAIRSVERAAEDAIESVTGAVNRGGHMRNVGEILTVIPAGNPGHRRRKNRMAATKRRRAHNRRLNRTRNTRHNRARVHRRHKRRTPNPRVIVRYRNRRHNRHYNRGRRRNPDFLSGDLGAAVGIVAGMSATGAITKAFSNFLPSTGLMAVLSTAGVGLATGFAVSRFNRRFGNQMMLGGLVLAVWELISQYFPAITLPFGVTGSATPVTTSGGMGLLTSSNFFVPQVNVPGSMATFVAPAAIPAPVVVASGGKMSGLGYGVRTIRRTGRLR